MRHITEQWIFLHSDEVFISGHGGCLVNLRIVKTKWKGQFYNGLTDALFEVGFAGLQCILQMGARQKGHRMMVYTMTANRHARYLR